METTENSSNLDNVEVLINRPISTTICSDERPAIPGQIKRNEMVNFSKNAIQNTWSF